MELKHDDGAMKLSDELENDPLSRPPDQDGTHLIPGCSTSLGLSAATIFNYQQLPYYSQLGILFITNYIHRCPLDYGGVLGTRPVISMSPQALALSYRKNYFLKSLYTHRYAKNETT